MARRAKAEKYLIQCKTCKKTQMGRAGRGICTHCVRTRYLIKVTEKKHHEAHYLPTPEEIKAECLKFQASWTPEERREHTVQKVPRVSIDRQVYAIAKGSYDDRPTYY
jgi:hypothetical protein